MFKRASSFSLARLFQPQAWLYSPCTPQLTCWGAALAGCSGPKLGKARHFMSEASQAGCALAEGADGALWPELACLAGAAAQAHCWSYMQVRAWRVGEGGVGGRR